MMKGFTFGQYYPATSVLHRMDPRAKLIAAFFYIVSTFLCNTLVSFLTLLLSSFVLIFISQIPLKTVLNSVKPLLFIIAFTFFINIFWTKGETKLTPDGWWITVYAEGVLNAFYILCRIFVLVIGTGVLLTYTTTPMELTNGLERLLAPLKKIHVPVHDFAMMMTITLRFIPTLAEETEKIMNAQKARGADFTHGSLVKRAKALIPILIPLFVSAINRAFDLAHAMECRCYHGDEGRTRLKVLHYKAKDFVLIGFIIAFCVALIFINKANFGGVYVLK